MIEKPNDFVKSTKSSKGDELTRTESERLNFWTEFNHFIAENGKPFNIRKASTDHWYDVALGTSEAHISITLVNKDKNIGVDVYINDNKDLFDELFSHKDEIELKLGFSMIWDRMEEKKVSRIKSYIPGLNFAKQDNYPELMSKIVEKVVIIRDVFKGYM